MGFTKSVTICLLVSMAIISLSFAESSPAKNSIMLASKRTQRPNPLNKFETYNGGWDIKDRSYLASVAYSGAPFFIAGGVWFVLFWFGALLGICYVCCFFQDSPEFIYRKKSDRGIIKCFLLIFITATLGGSATFYAGEETMNTKLSNTLDSIVRKSELTQLKLLSVTGYLRDSKTRGPGNATLPTVQRHSIDDVILRLNGEAQTLDAQTTTNISRIRKTLKFLRIFTIVIASVMLAITCLGHVLSVRNKLAYILFLVAVAWLIVTASFFMCGFHLAVYNAVSDACSAMNEWVARPQVHSALDNLIPCVDSETASDALKQERIVSTDLVLMVNNFIEDVVNKNNKLGSPVPKVCDPYTYNGCPHNQANVSTAAEVWKDFMCDLDQNGECKSRGRLTPSMYKEIVDAVTVVDGLYRSTPFLQDLRDCGYVKDIFMRVQTYRCSAISDSVKLTFVGLGIVSVAVGLSVIFWLSNRC